MSTVAQIDAEILQIPLWDLHHQPVKKLLNFSHVYKHINKLGEGGTGITNLYKGPLGEVAIKSMPIRKSKIAAQIKEITVHKAISTITTSVPKLYDHFIHEEKGVLYLDIVMEVIKGIELFTYIEMLINEEKEVNYEIFLQIAISLMETLAVMHAHNFVHRDIKPDNIIFSGDRIVLIDFGFSCSTTNKLLLCNQSIAGTLSYVSPEMATSSTDLKDLEMYKAADVWSAGITLHCLVEQFNPYDMAESLDDMEQYLMENPIDFQYIDPEIANVLQPLLQYNYQERITAADAVTMLKAEYEKRF